VGPGSATSGSRFIFIDSPVSTALYASIKGNKISACERAVSIYAASAITVTDVAFTGNNCRDDVAGGVFAHVISEGSVTLGSRIKNFDNEQNSTSDNFNMLFDNTNKRGIEVSNSYATPEGNVTAGVGSIYISLASGVRVLWMKSSGTGNTGWVQMIGVASAGNIGEVLTSAGSGAVPTWNANTNGFRNRIINGAMVIDQRGSASSPVTINSSAYTYAVDRWAGFGSNSDGVYTIQRSTTAPAGFINSLLSTVTTADASISSGQYYILKHAIEGLNVADLNWGTANAATVTLSFWVRSSLTGAFSGSITNNAFNRAYPFSFTINAANTWEQKSVTITGDTTGTWLTDNGAGLVLYMDLGSGSATKGTAGAWTGSGLVGVTGSANFIATNGATFYITGVQLEKGSTATAFEYRPYGTELALCQRYCQIVSRAINSLGIGSSAIKQSSAQLLTTINYQQMRSSPTWSNAPSSWDTSGSPSATQAFAYDFSTASFVTITGSLSITQQLGVNQGRFYYVASSSFSGGSTGGTFALGIGADMILTAEL
jgi:hypothetical protein